MAAPALPRPWLVHARLDGWLVGWAAVALWVGSVVATAVGHPPTEWGISMYWPVAVIAAMHFGMSYQLAYRDGVAAVRRRPFALAIGPLLLGGVLLAALVGFVGDGGQPARTALRLLLTSVLVLTTWHYLKQAYGVTRLGARYAGISLRTAEVRVLRYGLYPMWAIFVVKVFSNSSASRYASFDLGLDLLARGLQPWVRVAAIVGGIAVAVVLTGIGVRHHRLPPAMMVAPNLAAFLWFVFPADAYTAVLGLTAAHGVQYLACCHRAVPLDAASRGQARLRWLQIFGGAAAGGLLLSVWLPSWLDDRLTTATSAAAFSAAFFVFLNLHHYLIDASIWRSSGELVRSMTSAPAVVPTPATAPVSA
jgi:hypothetical protein